MRASDKNTKYFALLLLAVYINIMNKTFGMAIIIVAIIGTVLSIVSYQVGCRNNDPFCEASAVLPVLITIILVIVLAVIGSGLEIYKRSKAPAEKRKSFLLPITILLVIAAALVYYWFRDQIPY
jgi:hydrogenase-4 membrane subunit HyfE